MKNTPIIVEEIEKVLKEVNNERYYSKEEKDGQVIKEILNKGIVIEDLNRYEECLIKGILKNDILKNHFTKNIVGSTIVLIDRLIELLEANVHFDNSFTNYKNEIGLAVDRNFIRETNAVVLDFPYKDAILKAGMTKEDVEKFQDVDEDFYHELINAEERDRLFDEKIFVNSKRYDSNGVNYIDSFSDNDNLIIKGNNLIALSSLLEKYEGKVKMIYIDPPYFFENKKQADTFNYNSHFKLSTWLTFMKNRLILAKRLLMDKGVIFVSISDPGQAYLKVLMDEIFEKSDFVETFIWRNSDNPDALGSKSRQGVEYIHAYEINKDNSYKWKGNPSANNDAPLFNSGNGIQTRTFPKGSIKFSIPDGEYKAGEYNSAILETDLLVENSVNKNDVTITGRYKWGQELINKEIKKGTYFLVKSNKFSIRYQRMSASIMSPEKMLDQQYLSKSMGVGTNEDSNSHLKKLGINFSFSKPESLLAYLIRAVTEEKDIVLDFFMGSATTQAVAMKMNRQFIGIEQMDYITTTSIPRLLKVIEGEQGGISKSVNWQGGGSFVYVELMEKSRGYIKDLQKADSYNSLKEIYDRMLDNVDINFKVDLKKVKEIINEAKISVEDMKKMLIQIIDKNQLYYNYSEIEDENVRGLISDSDYKFNKSFYEGDIYD